MVVIETPEKYFYDIEKVNSSQKHHESRNSYQSFIDDILVFKMKNREITLEEIIMYAKGVIAGRSIKKSVLEARKELKR